MSFISEKKNVSALYLANNLKNAAHHNRQEGGESSNLLV